MEFIPYRDLQYHITEQPLAEPEAATVVSQVAQALQYMHKLGFVHRNLKPQVIWTLPRRVFSYRGG